MKDKKDWNTFQINNPRGKRVHGVVSHHHTFGVELEIDRFECQCLVEIIEFKNTGRMTPEEFPAVGSRVEAEVLGYNEYPDGKQICRLSMKKTFGLDN